MRTAAEQGAAVEFDLRVVRADGEVRNVIVKGQPEFRAGEVEAMFGVLTDVTEAFAAIAAMRDQHEMLDLAAELAQLGHWVWNCEEQAMSFCSDELARIHGLSVPAFLARFTHPEEFATAVVPDHAPRYRAMVLRALTEAEPYAIEYRIVTPSGQAKDLREIGHPLFDGAAGLTRFIGTVQDISEAKCRENELQQAKAALEQQAEALRRSEQKFRDIIEGSIQGIVILRDFRPVFANQAYARILGLNSADEVLALGDLRRVMAQDATQGDAFWSTVMAGKLDGKTRRAGIKTIDGRTVWTDAIGRVIEWEGEPAFLVTVIDVTERHLGEQELQAKTRQLQDSNLQKDKLFSIIAHDLKAPFNSVIGFSDLLAARASVLPPEKIADYARIVRDAATSVHGLFDNLLTWAAFQLRDSAPRLVAVDLSAAADESMEPLVPLSTEKGVAIVNAIPQSAPGVRVLADEDLLRIVLRNIVSNGIKFCHSGGEVRLSAVAGAEVRITIRDTGVGMAEAEVANLFRLDRPVSMPGTRGEKGTGLGLYLCRDIIDRHGGSITCEAALNRGTAFHITLPAVAA
jgi:PAS domain S-box-containing protein